nr:AAA family ATPase [Methylocystis sp. WRRC1]
MVGVLTNETANYYCVSVFRETAKGHFVRRIECFEEQFVLVIDDVGTKINLKELLRVIPLPTYVLETSPGNYHYGFRITNGRDARVIAALIDSIISDELINPSLRDPGMVGVTRVVRLPVGANCKPAIMAKNGGKPWPHVMHVWEPSRAYSVEQMAEELDVDISPEALARFKGGGHTRKATAAEVGIDPLMKLFDARGMLIDATPNDNGFVAIKCPWAADHSDARDEAGYRPGSGGFQCHHGHCEGKGMNELRAWVEEAFTGAERAAALAETFGPVNENDPVLQGEIKRAMMRDPAYRAIFRDGDDDDDGGNRNVVPVRLVAASKINPERVDWLWNGYLARGKMHLLAGPSTAGKTTVAIMLAAILSTGGTWPDGTRASAADVLIWSGEDGIADTIVPRLLAAGADASRVHVIQAVKDGRQERAFDPSRDMAALSAALDAPELRGKVRLLVVDSLASAIAGDAHRNNEVRRGLQPVVDLAERHGVAVLGIVHFSKGTQGRNVMERINGSLAFGALARIVLICAVEEKEDGSRRCMFLRGPSNIGPTGGGWTYEIIESAVPGHDGIRNTVATFRDPLTGSAQTILNIAEGVGEEGGGGALAGAEAFLREKLKNGPVAVSEIKAHAGAEGFAWRTLERAKGRLDISAVKIGKSWSWRLITAAERFAEESADAPF